MLAIFALLEALGSRLDGSLQKGRRRRQQSGRGGRSNAPVVNLSSHTSHIWDGEADPVSPILAPPVALCSSTSAARRSCRSLPPHYFDFIGRLRCARAIAATKEEQQGQCPADGAHSPTACRWSAPDHGRTRDVHFRSLRALKPRSRLVSVFSRISRILRSNLPMSTKGE